MSSPQFYTEVDLLDRLSHGALSSDRQVVFLVGAAVSAPHLNDGPGVPNVAGIVDLIRAQFSTNLQTLTDFDKVVTKAGPKAYQTAFTFLQGRRGQDSANDIIRRAVLSAHVQNDSHPLSKRSLSEIDFRALESDSTGWQLPPAITALAQILSRYKHPFGGTILTSNFDPLIEIGMNACGGHCHRTMLAGDGGLEDTSALGTKVVHLHGYWYGSDTLHTPQQLGQPRPRLTASLTALLSNSTVVVLGYGGWDDIFTRSLVDVVSNHTSSPDVIWCFYEQDDRRIRKQSKEVITQLTPGINRGRVSMYSGINCHLFFPKLLSQLQSIPSDEPHDRKLLLTHNTNENITSSSAHRATEAGMSELPPAAEIHDSPPRVDAWVGRTNELETLLNTSSPVVAITGIGGQGKSALAATYLKKAAGTRFEFWDWRDCREEGDRFNTQLSSIIERLSVGELRASDIEGQDTNSLTEVFFRVLGKRRGLFVFDNVDHYIDLERRVPASALGNLLDKALRREHSSRFVITCRPNIRATDPGMLPIGLKEGLSEEETRQLFRLRGANLNQYAAEMAETHQLTAGHPLWLNLIAVQVAGNVTTLPRLLAAIKKGQHEASEGPPLDAGWDALKERQKIMLDPIWATLKDKAKIILRTMAEMVRPERTERLSEYLRKHMYDAQFRRHMSDLITLNLIVVKPRENATDLLDLHPVVRDYIRGRFHKADQLPFLRAIIIVLDGLLRPREESRNDVRLEELEDWTQAVELNINIGNISAAASKLRDIMGELLAFGYPEEFIRVARKLFDSFDWERELRDPSVLDFIFDRFISTLTDFGERVTADEHLRRYESVLTSKGVQYVTLCKLRCYFHWYGKQFEDAIEWGERGAKLTSQAKADIKASSEHALALARRDAGQVEKALTHFLESVPLDRVIHADLVPDSKHADFYGNIGRCLQFMGKLDEALVCYRKSALLLERQGPEQSKRLNQGYVRLWIGETLELKRQHNEAAIFLRAATLMWEKTSPPRAIEAEQRLAALIEKNATDNVMRLQQNDVERVCLQWMSAK